MLRLLRLSGDEQACEPLAELARREAHGAFSPVW